MSTIPDRRGWKILNWVLYFSRNGEREPCEAFTFSFPMNPRRCVPVRTWRGRRIIRMSCHSVDYISTQPPQRGKEFWEVEVKKMIKLYPAPSSFADAKTIADYLTKTY